MKTTKIRSRSKNKCDYTIKSLVSSCGHKKCHSGSHKSVEIVGKRLNSFLNMNSRNGSRPAHVLNDRKKVSVCYTLMLLIKRYERNGTSTNIHPTPELSPSTRLHQQSTSTSSLSSSSPTKRCNNSNKKRKFITPSAPTVSRSERLAARNRVPIGDVSKLKKVKVVVNDKVYKEIDLTKRRSAEEIFKESVLSDVCRKPFNRLLWREKKNRINEISYVILNKCIIDRPEFRKNGNDYLKGNEEVALNIIDLIDGVRKVLEKRLKVEFKSIADRAIPPIEGDTDGSISFIDETKLEYELAVSLLGETSRNGYERIKKKVNKRSAAIAKGTNGADGTTNHTTNKVRSYHMLTMNRPKVEHFSEELYCLPVGSTSAERRVQPAVLAPLPLVPRPTPQPTTEDDTPQPTTEDDILQHVASASQEKAGTVEGSLIKGTYETYVQLIEKKHKDKGRPIGTMTSPLVIDSIDGAEHQKSKNKVTSVISFSTCIICPTSLKSGAVTAGSSKNILTWKQARGTESIQTMTPVLKGYLDSKLSLKNKAVEEQTAPNNENTTGVTAASTSNNPDRSKYFYYELHDGKMLYLLTPHGLYSRTDHPFLLCACEKGEGVMDAEWTCTLIDDVQQQRLFTRSQRQWTKMTSKVPSIDWKTEEHMDWAAVFNKGCSHFGVSPELLPRSSLRFDTFHLKCQVTRNLMTYLRRFLLNQSGETQDAFSSKVLSKFWNGYHLYCWEHNKNFSSFQGNELALFVANEEHVKKFLTDNLVMTEKLQDVLTGLSLWKSIFRFLAIARLREDDVASTTETEKHITMTEYINLTLKFKSDVKLFYTVGSRTFLSRRGTEGEDETFYMHCLRYYLPGIVDTTFERHGCGVGIFNMQGFERRNKESKNIYNNNNNHRGKLNTNINRLWDIFEHDDVMYDD